MLEMIWGDNATRNGCLALRKKWAGNNPEKLGSCHRTTVKNIRKNTRKKRRHTIKNIIGGK